MNNTRPCGLIGYYLKEHRPGLIGPVASPYQEGGQTLFTYYDTNRNSANKQCPFRVLITLKKLLSDIFTGICALYRIR